MPLPRDDRFWSKVVRIAVLAGLTLGTGTLVIVYVTIQRFEAELRKKGGGEFIEAALTVERQMMMLILLLIFGVAALNLYAVMRSRNWI
jgi:ABC-type lipoprotein release transport system permease subunit